MSAQMLQSLGGVFHGMSQNLQGAGQTATPGMQQALMSADNNYPNMPASMAMTPGMASDATVAGIGANAPASLTAGLSPQDAFYAQMAKNLQTQSDLAPLQGLADVGKTFIDKNVESRHQMPLAAAFGMASDKMGPLPFGSSQSPLLTYLSMLGAR